jgi:(p)ppGpp synthase/HD superfamily hydrolase
MNRDQLLCWVKQKHEGQTIKRTDLPYLNHLVAVATLAGPVTVLGYEIGLCHDLLEDTPTSENELRGTLISLGYPDLEADYITACVVELTDAFTAAAYPGLNKKSRKTKEAMRLLTISPGAQTVKYADLIDNIGWVLAHDRENAATYLQKKQALLSGMTGGDQSLRQKALDMIRKGLIGVTDISK